MESDLFLLISILALIVFVFVIGLLLCCPDLYVRAARTYIYKYEDEEQNRNYNESMTNRGRTTRAAQARQEERQGESVRPHPQQEPRPDQTSQRTDGKTANAERNISKERWDTEGPMEDLARKLANPELYEWRQRLRVTEIQMMEAHPEGTRIKRILASEEQRASLLDTSWPPQNTVHWTTSEKEGRTGMIEAVI